MRAVVQRVERASVAVGNRVVGEIGHGLLVLVGVGEHDGDDDARALAAKLARLRIFSDDEGRMNRSLADCGGSALVVSQFTLYGTVRKGNRPSFGSAGSPERAEPLVELVAHELAEAGVPVAMGEFGASMRVELVNDGPVTLIVETDGGRVT